MITVSRLIRITSLICLIALQWACANRPPRSPARSKSDQLIQTVVDRVSQADYQHCQLDIESMGLGRYGGDAYNMDYRVSRAQNDLKEMCLSINLMCCLSIMHLTTGEPVLRSHTRRGMK